MTDKTVRNAEEVFSPFAKCEPQESIDSFGDGMICQYMKKNVFIYKEACKVTTFSMYTHFYVP